MKILAAIVVTVVCQLLLLPAAWSETSYDRQGDVIVPGAELYEGVVDRVNIEGDVVQSVIINDTLYRVDGDTVVRTAKGGAAKLEDLQEGSRIDFYALGHLLTKVMPAGKNAEQAEVEPPAPAAPRPSSTPASVYQEGGVWKN